MEEMRWNMLELMYLLSLIVSVVASLANIPRKRTTLAPGLEPALRQGPWNVL